MAVIQIITTAEEQRKVLEVIAKFAGETIPMVKIGKESKIPENRVRYVITDLLEAGKITREATKALSKHYVRYKYELVK